MTERAPRLSIGELVAAAKRELAQRERVYPRLVEAGKMTKAAADYQVRAMGDILETLREIEVGGRLI